MSDAPAPIFNAAMHPFEWSPWHPWFAWLPVRLIDNSWGWGRVERAIRWIDVGIGYWECQYRALADRRPLGKGSEVVQHKEDMRCAAVTETPAAPSRGASGRQEEGR